MASPPRSLRAVARNPKALARYLKSRDQREQPLTTADTARLTKRDALRVAMAAEKKVSIEYTRKDGQTRQIVARPYSVRRRRGKEYLYVQIDDDRHGSGIHSLLMPRAIHVATLGRTPFRPRWPTEPESV